MKLKKAAALVLASLLAAGTVCLTACSGNTEETQEALLGTWIPESIIHDDGYTEPYTYDLEVDLKDDLSEQEIQKIGEKIKKLEYVSTCTLVDDFVIGSSYIENGVWVEDNVYESQYQVWIADRNQTEDVVTEIENLDGVEGIYFETFYTFEENGKLVITHSAYGDLRKSYSTYTVSGNNIDSEILEGNKYEKNMMYMKDGTLVFEKDVFDITEIFPYKETYKKV